MTATATAAVRAVEWHGAGMLRLSERHCPQPGAGQLLVEVSAIGICGTDLGQWRGNDGRTRPGVVIGHEFGGVVTGVGPGASGWRPGDLVAVDPNVSCGTCEHCRSGERASCAQRQLLGFERDGGMQTSVVMPSTQAIRVGAGTDPRALALVEPVAVAIRACRRAGVSHGRRVGVIGGGPIGAACARVVLEAGAQPVVIERDDARRQALLELGAELESPADADTAPWDLGIDTVGSLQTAELAFARLRRGGTLCTVGLASSGSLPASSTLVRRELTARGSFCYSTAELHEAALLVAAHGLATIPTELVTDLDRAPEVLRALASGVLPPGKVLILP
ncbi:alcohol dehydrogenase catalytic domain-containing protein [Streptomyces sp. RB6PN25]|uniref:2-deoxy-scyllo-inosamine dehydrogenase n=1 Tax=Streptomyces humicola TaxID=2953240 RepID=A0ABT1PV35_9ACTN|nr:alcohol dehydrogenase catalytic domain-containing protein [Streptomyces humicola]MCQ4080875.1 alcohol dehydrogenase catalytic domain-containing protein [Streptomyces humicola]